MQTAVDPLWHITTSQPGIDPTELAEAIRSSLEEESPDFRTKVLIRDSFNALKSHWGAERVSAWLLTLPQCAALEKLCKEDLGRVGFPSLERRLMDFTRPETIQQFLRQLGGSLRHPVRLEIGGSAALILAGSLSRSTEDVDVVNEVPAEIRSQYQLLDELVNRFGLHVAHFLSRYLPAGRELRLKSMGRFGMLDVFLVDAGDIFISKLLSSRKKDTIDLHVLARQFDKEALADRVRRDAKSMLAEPMLAENAVKNWYILFGETLTF